MLRRDDARRPAPEKRVEDDSAPASVVVFALAGRFPSDGINNRITGPPVTVFENCFFPQILAVILFRGPPSFFIDCFSFRHPLPRRTAMRTRLFRRPRQNARLDKVRRKYGKVRAFKRTGGHSPNCAFVSFPSLQHAFSS